MVDAVNPPILEKDIEKNAKKEKVEVKVEVEVEAEATIEPMQGKQIIDDPKFMQGPINIASLSPIQKLQLALFAQEKASEDLLMSHTEDNMFLTLETSILENECLRFKRIHQTLHPSN